MENGRKRERGKKREEGKGRHMGAMSKIQGDAPYNFRRLFPSLKAKGEEKVSLKGAILLSRPQVL